MTTQNNTFEIGTNQYSDGYVDLIITPTGTLTPTVRMPSIHTLVEGDKCRFFNASEKNAAQKVMTINTTAVINPDTDDEFHAQITADYDVTNPQTIHEMRTYFTENGGKNLRLVAHFTIKRIRNESGEIAPKYKNGRYFARINHISCEAASQHPPIQPVHLVDTGDYPYSDPVCEQADVD